MPFVTPDDVRQLQASVRSQRDAIQFSIGACPAAKADAVLMAQWDAYDVVVNAFIDDDAGWLDAAAEMDAGQQIQRDLVQWAGRIRDKGCGNVPPAPVGPPPSALQQATSLVEAGVAAVAVVALAVVLVKARRK